MARHSRRMRRADVDEFMLDLEIEPLEEGGYVATSPAIQGLVAQGRTLGETVEIARDVARKIIESCIEHGDPLPALRSRPRRRMSTAVPVQVVR